MFPNIRDASSFYRGAGPLASLRHLGCDVNLTCITKSIDWPDLKFADILFLQRPFLAEHQKLAEMAKQLSVPVWIDHDDHLLGIPNSNTCDATYGSEQTQRTIKYLVSIADAVTVSTPALRVTLEPFSDKISVIPNAWDDYAYPVKNLQWLPREKLIVWRGSSTHVEDLTDAADRIVGLHEQFPDVQFVFIGYRPWFIENRFKDKSKFVFQDWVPLTEYFFALRMLRPLAVLAPLQDTTFNRCKSNIAYLEARYAGAPCLTTHALPEWLERYGPWAEVVRRALDEPKTARFDFTFRNMELLSFQNEKRVQLIEKLLGRGPL
jgi:hypothetical protein